MKVRLRKDYNRIMPEKKHWLTKGVDYFVIGIECDWYRILNDRNDPVLYSPTLFDITDATEPSNWIAKTDDGCRYAYPEELNAIGFWDAITTATRERQTPSTNTWPSFVN